MCGIAGVIDPTCHPTRHLLENMAKTMVNRGPDGSGQWLNGSTGLVHQRLSIIDLSGGEQPMTNEDGTLILTFNGEIYDYQSLRQELQQKGHRFKTRSDSEVLLHLYEEYGPQMLDRINGMFAFAIYNTKNKALFFARDRLGQKPLFYSHKGKRFAFASGPSALQTIPWISLTIDRAAIDEFLFFQYIPTPQTIYQEIRKLPPGHFGIWENNQLSIQPYWIPEIAPNYLGSYTEASLQLENLLQQAVNRRLVSDVPLGVFLSGGLDSSILCLLASRATSGKIDTFSIGFPDNRYDERDYARCVSEHLGTNHHFLEVNPQDFERLPTIVKSYEEPYADSSMLPTLLLSEFTKKRVTVALSGDGADELFGGYYRYQIMHKMRNLDSVPMLARKGVKKILDLILPSMQEERSAIGKIRRIVNLLDKQGLEKYIALTSRFPLSLKQLLYDEPMHEFLGHGYPQMLAGKTRMNCDLSFVDQVNEMDLSNYLNDDILVKVDRASMAVGLEVRSPFLDPMVVAFALSLPYNWKQKGKERKRLLTDTFAQKLPRQITTRPKMGFGVPIGSWMRHEWKNQITDHLLHGDLVNKHSLITPKGMNALLNKHFAGQGDFSYPLFSLLMLELWLTNCHTTR